MSTATIQEKSIAEQTMELRPIYHSPEELLCNACRRLCIDAFQTSHPCRICHECRAQCQQRITCQQRLTNEYQTVICPSEQCTSEITESDLQIPDFLFRKNLEELQFYCPNDKCPLTIPFSQLETHKNSCDYEDIVCNKCNLEMARNELDQHNDKQCPHRIVICPLCEETITAESLTSSHYQLTFQNCCRQFKGPCPYCQEIIIDKDELEESHKENCPGKPRPCCFQKIGCTFYDNEQSVESHEGNDHFDHMKFLENRVQTMMTLLDKKEAQIADLVHQNSQVQKLWVITNVEIKRDLCQPLLSPYYYTGEPGYKFRVKLCLHANKQGEEVVSMYVLLQQGQFDQMVPWPCQARMTAELVDLSNVGTKSEASFYFCQRRAGERFANCFERPPEEGNNGYGSPRLLTHAKAFTSQFVQDDKIFVRITIDKFV